MEPADVVLLERWIGRRDAEAFQALVKRYSAMVFSACRRVLGDAARAEDVTQECFLKLAMGDARPGPFLGPWLHRVATRRCLDTLRTERRRRAREARYVAEGPQAVEVRWELLEPLIDEALAELPERYRVPVTLHFLEGLSHEEVARRLDTPRRTVSYRIGQGLERMGTRLRSRGVNVASGVLIAQMGKMPVEAPPVELAARLSKMALARAARVLPHAHWLGVSPMTYGVGALVALAVAVTGWVGVARTFAVEEKAAAPRATALALTPAAQTPKPDRKAAGVSESVTPVGPAANAAPEETAVASVAPAAEDTPEPCAIAGSVVDESRQPIPNAAVLVLRADHGAVVNSGTPALPTRTDAQGLFRITDIPSKMTFLLVAGAEGFDSPSVTSYLLEPGKTLEDQCIVLARGVTLSGRVLGRDGLPVANALVMRGSFQSDTYSGGGGNVCALTDEKGLFQLGYPRDGTAVLQVMTQAWGNAIFEVAVQPGAMVELRMPASAQVAGRVTHPDGSSANGLRVVFRAMSGDGTNIAHFEAHTLIEGLYQISSLPPDLAYEAVVVDESSEALSSRVALGVLTAGSSTKHDFRLEAPAIVRGTVTGEQTGRPQTGARIGWIRDKESNNRAAETGENGGYELQIFLPGTYWIYPIPASGEWGEDNAQTYGRSVTLTLGAEQTVDFRLPDAFSLGVRVVDGQGRPVENALVEAASSSAPGHVTSLIGGQTDASGRYRYTRFRAGCEGWLRAYVPAHGGTNKGPDVETLRVVGEPGVDYPEETVVLYGSSGLNGTAVGPDGQQLANCLISLRLSGPGIVIDGARAGEFYTNRDVQADGSGAFTLDEGVPATSLSLTALTQGEDGRVYRCDVAPVDCPAGQDVNLGRLTFQVDPDAKREVVSGGAWFVNTNGE
ncbi:MAG: sigma-70 family RNA polymerase sigma factor [FCB group bacterium]|jgi:RNA polymerase sigma factor (sigma-70 family)|nr:sigma-70 family RNA polymerase sigma factor [FCB group bacterium]